MLSDGTTAYQYDAYGNLEYEIRASDGDYLRQYVWDGENHLLTVKLWTAGIASTATAPDTTVAMGYDDQGGRVARTQTDGSGESETVSKARYLTDYGNPTGYSQVLEQLDSSATSAEKDFIYGADLLAQADSGGGPAYLLGDHLGSTRLLTDGAGGAITDTAFDYSPYGEPLGTSGSLTVYPHAFTGPWRDDTLGMQFHRARWLNLNRSAWASSDPIFDFPNNFGQAQGYVGSNPINACDRTGADFSLVGFTATSAIIGGLAGIALDSYLHNGFSLDRAWRVALAGAAMGALIGLILGGAVVGLLGVGFSLAEAWLFISVLTAPINIAFAAKSAESLPDTERGRKAGKFLIGLSIVLALLGPVAGYLSATSRAANASSQAAGIETAIAHGSFEFVEDVVFRPAAEANREFTPEPGGYIPPYDEAIDVIEFKTKQPMKFIRFFSGDRTRGRFLSSENELEGRMSDLDGLQRYLGLKDPPQFWQEVVVPEGTPMRLGRIGPQPNFGFENSGGFQWQLFKLLDESAYGPATPIK